MRHINARSRGWLVILLVLFLCFAACMSQGMGFAPAAYSPTASKNELAGRHAPGGGGYSANHDAADNFILTPEQSVRLWKEGECVRHHPALEPSLPSMNITSCHAVFTMMYQRPRSELASRSGGHAPPGKKPPIHKQAGMACTCSVWNDPESEIRNRIKQGVGCI